MFGHDRRADYLKKKKIFYRFSENVKWAPSSIPAEQYLVSIGNNVRVAAGVSFITHDIINGMICCDPVVVENMVGNQMLDFIWDPLRLVIM